jgi:signal transduction histidine kinase
MGVLNLSPLFLQVLNLLVTPAGSLAYHLALAFALLGALQVSLNHAREMTGSAPLRRTALGLGLLLALQVAFFVVSLLALQGVLDAADWLPPVDRAVTLIGLVFIVWLWAFAQPSPAGDSAALLLALLAVTAAVLGALWWAEQDTANLQFNQVWLDQMAQIASLVVLGLGALVLLLRRPEGWTLGLVMFVLLAAGHALQLLFPLPADSDYPGAVRLAQLASVYFYFMLPQRFSSSAGVLAVSKGAAGAAQAERSAAPSQTYLHADPQVWQTLHNLVMETDPERVCQIIVSSTARIAQADVCLLAFPPDEQGRITVRSGYDQSRGRYMEKVNLEARSLPALASALRMGRIRHLNAHSTSLDLPELSHILNIDRTGNVLIVPILMPDGQAVSGLILLTPYSTKDWSADEQSFFGTFGRLLVHFLQRSQETASLKDEVSQVRLAIRTAQDQAQIAIEDRRKVQDQLTVAREENQRSRAQLEGMANLLSDQIAVQQEMDTLKAALQELQDENETLKAESARALEEQSHSMVGALDKGQSVEGELRLALEEVAFLQTMLAEADQKITALKTTRISETSYKGQIDEITTILQELRQPLSSLIGYVDFLLSESVGILGNAQRKYLERIKVSIQRMGRLVDDLVQVVNRDTHLMKSSLGEVNLGMIIQSAVAENNPILREKRIAMHMDLGDTPMYVYTDKLSLRKALASLLHNAASVTPEDGSVSLNACLQSSEGEEDYVLVQIADTGGGISPQDLPRVFLSPQLALPGASEHIAGLSNGNMDLSAIKSAIESMGGRTWVDSDLGAGSTFSVLLPVNAASHLKMDAQAGD